MLIMTSVFSGIFNGLALPARQAMIAELVSREQLMNAVSLNSMGQNISTLIGPSIAGFLIGGIGYKAVYGAMVGLYLIAVILTNQLPVTGIVTSRGRTTFEDVSEGLKYIRRNPTILLIILFNLLCILLAMPRNQLMPIFATDILNVGASGQGVMQSVGAIGALIASLTYASLPSKRRGIIMLFAGLNLGLTLTVFAFSRSYILSIAMMVFIGMGQTGHMSMGTILIQTLSDREYVGRSMSVLLMCQASASLGTFFVGVIAQFAGAQHTVAGLGIVLIFVATGSLLFLPRLRKLD